MATGQDGGGRGPTRADVAKAAYRSAGFGRPGEDEAGGKGHERGDRSDGKGVRERAAIGSGGASAGTTLLARQSAREGRSGCAERSAGGPQQRSCLDGPGIYAGCGQADGGGGGDVQKARGPSG